MHNTVSVLQSSIDLEFAVYKKRFLADIFCGFTYPDIMICIGRQILANTLPGLLLV